MVYATDLRTLDSCCVLRSREAVLKMLIAPDKGLWLSMTNSDIEYWDVEPVLQVPAPPWSLRAPCARVLANTRSLVKGQRRCMQSRCMRLAWHASCDINARTRLASIGAYSSWLFAPASCLLRAHVCRVRGHVKCALQARCRHGRSHAATAGHVHEPQSSVHAARGARAAMQQKPARRVCASWPKGAWLVVRRAIDDRASVIGTGSSESGRRERRAGARIMGCTIHASPCLLSPPPHMSPTFRCVQASKK